MHFAVFKTEGKCGASIWATWGHVFIVSDMCAPRVQESVDCRTLWSPEVGPLGQSSSVIVNWLDLLETANTSECVANTDLLLSA
jgi:hypothetical protein